MFCETQNKKKRMSVSFLRKCLFIKNINLPLNKFKISIATTKCLASDDSAEKNATEIPKLDNLKEVNPFFSKYESKLKKVYE